MFKDMGLRIMSVNGNDLEDVTEYIGAGAMISDDEHIMIYYGVMLADANTGEVNEGAAYAFSPEGETLISDGSKDGHLKIALYFEKDNVIEAEELNQTVIKGDASVSGLYDIDPSVLSGDIKFVTDGLPSWLGFNGNGSTISYQTGDLSDVEAGEYKFSILAYVGDDALTSPHKLYAFTITVQSPALIGGYYYATTDMTWAEFYAGEVNQTASELETAGLDAITSPTTYARNRFPVLVSSADENGSTITGLKAVQVRMSEAVYEALTSKTRYTFSDEAFSEYKDVNADGSFGKMVTATTTATGAAVTLRSGASATWGNYQLNISNASVDIGLEGSGRSVLVTKYLGALIETSDGTIYGMRHDCNLWSTANDIAFCVNDKYAEPHGASESRAYEYTASLEGKTITKITFMLKDIADVIIDNLTLTVPSWTDVTVNPEKSSGKYVAEDGLSFSFKFSDTTPAYTLKSISLGSGRNSKAVDSSAYTYSDGVLTFTGTPEAGSYKAVFTADSYVDISASFTITETPTSVDGYYYATTNMTWAEFYAGETGETSSDLELEGLDAISTPTTAPAISRFVLLDGVSDDQGTTFYGLKEVQVRMSEAVYETLTSKVRYTFADESFSEYKELNADGSFGKMITEVTDASSTAKVTIAGGASATWGNYQITVSNVSIDIGLSDDKVARNYLGALIETSDGKIYGMRHDCNLWSDAGVIAFCVNDKYVEPHGRGVVRDYDYTASLAGKTISKITFMLKDIPDVVVASLDLEVPSWTDTTVNTEGEYAAKAGLSLSFTFSGDTTPAYTLKSVSLGSGRNRKVLDDSEYEYSDGVLTFKGTPEVGSYTAVFEAEGYIDISAGFTISEETKPEPTPSPSPTPTPTPSDDVRPTPSDDVRPTPSDDIRPTPSDDVRPTPSDDVRPTPSDDVRPTPSDDVRPEPTPTPSDDVRPTPTPEPDVRPAPVTPEEPRVDVDSVADRVIEILSSSNPALSRIITENTEVVELPASASGSERNISDLTSDDLAAIPETETVAGILPVMVVTRPAIYVFGATLNNLEAGATIFLHMMSDSSSANAAVFSSAADTEDAYTFLDDNGNEVTKLPANKHVNIAAYMEPGKTYAPVITTGSSSPTPAPTPTPSDDVRPTPTPTPTPSDDVRPTPTPTPTPSDDVMPTPASPGSSKGGGCDSFGLSSSAAFIVFALRKLRRK